MSDELNISLFSDDEKEKSVMAETILSHDQEQKNQKSPDAFRTISEVADDLQIPQHVLRFWETRFPEVSPIKRNGGRRYYRPEDIEILKHISDLLYVKGYTIKGVQRLLSEKSEQKLSPDANDISEDFSGEETHADDSSQHFSSEEPSKDSHIMETSSENNQQQNYQALWMKTCEEKAHILKKNALLVDTLNGLLHELEELRKQIKI